jgi:hypothetical protein
MKTAKMTDKYSIYLFLINTLSFFMGFFSLSTLTYRFWPLINRFIGAFIVVSLVLIYFVSLKKKDLIFLLLVLLVDCLSFLRVHDFKQNLNDAIYWTTTLLFIWKLFDYHFSSNLYHSIGKLKMVYLFLALANTIIIAIGFFLKTCYTDAWNGNYYLCFAYSQHSFCCSVCITMVMCLFCFPKIKSDLAKLAVFLILTYALFQSGARTYLLSLPTLWYFFIKYSIFGKKKRLLVFCLLLLGFILFFFKSSMFEKMVYTYNNTWSSENSLVSFSSGRFEFWLIDLNAYSKLDWFQKIFGSGFDYVYLVNRDSYGLYIWAHNDFINTLLCNGLFGLFVYCTAFFTIFKCRSHFRRYDFFWVFFYIFSVTFINGLFAYQHYLFSFVFLFIFAEFATNKSLHAFYKNVSEGRPLVKAILTTKQ